MKKRNVCFFIFTIACICSLSCNKYEDGPALSLISAKKRLVGTYNLEKYIVDDKEQTILYPVTITYKKDGTGERISKTLAENTITSEFMWEFDKKREQIRDREKGLNGTWGDWTPYKKILRLTKNELWLLEPTSIEIFEYHYKKQ
jgi:hypothetical protein